MSNYNPLFMDELRKTISDTYSGVTAYAPASGKVSEAIGAVKPLEFFGRYQFSDPVKAAEFIQTPQFHEMWGSKDVGLQNIGIRAEINDTGRFNSPRPRWDYNKELEYYKNNLERTLARPEKYAGEHARAIKIFDEQKVGMRAAGRFYTQQGLSTSPKNTAFYLDQWNSLGDNGYPIRLIADERVSRSSLTGGTPFNGNIPEYPNQLSVKEALTKNKGIDLSRATGRDLGLSLSSAPEGEVFVPSNLANNSKLVGKVNADRTVELIGKPKIPINNQIKANILPYIGGAMAKVSPYLGVVGTGVMAYQGYQDYNSDNMMTREYGATDPFGLRAGYDFGINVFSGSQSIPDAWETQRKLVADPEFQLRNPLAATLYNTAHGNFETLKAFAGGYIPEFLTREVDTKPFYQP